MSTPVVVSAPSAPVVAAAPTATATSTTVAPSTSATEHMIASNNIMRLSRGYNGMNTGGSYADAMNTLHEAEVMSLSSVETDNRSMNGAREPNS